MTVFAPRSTKIKIVLPNGFVFSKSVVSNAKAVLCTPNSSYFVNAIASNRTQTIFVRNSFCASKFVSFNFDINPSTVLQNFLLINKDYNFLVPNAVLKFVKI